MTTRRDILRAIALGGGLVAGELWIPGQRLISIVREKRLVGKTFYLDEPMVIENWHNFLIDNCRFIENPGFAHDHVLHFVNCSHGHVRNCESISHKMFTHD